MYGTGSVLNIITITNGDVESIALNIHVSSNISKYHQLGARHTHEPSDYTYRNKNSLIALANHFANLSEPVILERIHADSLTIPTLRAGFKYKGIVIAHKMGSCPYIKLDPGFDSVNHVLPKHLISDLRRARRKADKLGKVTFSIYSPKTQQEFLPIYNQFIDIEASSWKSKAGTALKQNPQQKEFYRQYGIRAAEQGILRVSEMYIDDEIVAIQYAVEWGEKFWLLKIGFNEKYAKCSPGMLLMQETLTYAMNNNLKSYEFLGSSETWTRRWTQTEWQTVRVEAYPFSIKGMLAFSYKVMLYGLNKTSTLFKTRHA